MLHEKLSIEETVVAHPERTPAPLRILHIQPDPLYLSQPHRNSQPQSKMFFLISGFILPVKSIKNQFFLLIRDSRSVVYDINHNKRTLIFRPQNDPSGIF